MRTNTRILMCFTLVSVVCISACTPATEPASSEDEAAVPMATATSETPAAPPRPATTVQSPASKPAAPTPKPVAAPRGPLLLNTSFESRADDGALSDWTVSSMKNIGASVDAYEGVHVLALTSTPEEFGIVAQRIQLEPSDLGKTAKLSAMGKAPYPGHLFLELRCTVDGEVVKDTVSWPESTDWTLAESNLQIPKNADPKSAKVRIMIRPGGQGKFLVDKVTLKLQ